MRDHKQVHAQLLSLMEEALSVCILLQNYTDENLDVFSCHDDREIIKAIKERESIIMILIKLEYKIDLILDEEEEYAYGCALPPEIDKVRHDIREILGSVLDTDNKAMKLLGVKMQQYKNETLKARNKKNLSAYIKTNFVAGPCGSYDHRK